MQSFFRRFWTRRPNARPLAAHRPRLLAERLEARDVPATFTVTSVSDDGSSGTLRWAIGQANSSGGADTINFGGAAFAGAQTVSLEAELPSVGAGGLTITGTGANSLTLTRNAGFGNFRLLSLSVSSSLTITDAKISNFNGDIGSGGAVYVDGNGALSLARTSLTGNTAGNGGAIYFVSGGSLTVDRSYFGGNIAAGAYPGTEQGGGAICTVGDVAVTISNSTFYANAANDTASLGGGAIYISSSAAPFSIRNSTLTNNTAVSGSGGAIHALSYFTGTLEIYSSIVSGNNGAAAPDIACIDPITANNSAIGSLLGFGGFTPASGNNLTPTEITNLKLATPPALNGGTTPNVQLNAGSSAIDRGNNAFSYTTDQRGTPRVLGAYADIGAYEVPTILPFVRGGPFDSVLVAGGGSYTFTLTFGDDSAINFGTVNGKNDVVQVTGPAGYSKFATFVSATPTANAASIVVTYTVAAANNSVTGLWDSSDNGSYSIGVVANKVADTDSTIHFITTTAVGKFTVATPTTYVVTTTADSGTGSFRAALTSSLSQPGQDTITFQSGLSGIITLLSALPTINDSLVINGPGASSLTLSGNNTTTLLTIDGPGLLDVRISGMTFIKGASYYGAGLYLNDESLTLNNVVISSNTASTNGGGLYVAGNAVVNVSNSTFANNVAQGTNSNNGGAGIFAATNPTITVTNSTFSGNVATNGRGGAIYFFGTGTLNVVQSTLSGNSAGNAGGAIALWQTSATIINSTLSNNTATLNGGGAISSNFDSTATFTSSLFANNAGGGTGPDAVNPAGTFNASNSLFTSIAGLTLSSDVANLKNVAISLNPLGSYGGSTLTQTLKAGSPAIDKGANPNALTTDQRGSGFARTFGAGTDIGATEFSSTAPNASLLSAPNVTTAGATSYTFTVQYTDDVALLASSLNNNLTAVTVQGPNAFSASILTATIDNNTNGTPRTVTYTFAPPGGAWDGGDSGAYTIALVANKISDTSANFAPAATLGSFSVAIPVNYVITTTADSGAGSLRQALLDSNASFGLLDTITFSSLFNSAQTINLTVGDLTISDSVIITGKGSALTTINAAGKADQRHFVIQGSGTLSVQLSGLRLTGASETGTASTDRGGSIYIDDESVTLADVWFDGNKAQASGGAIAVNAAAATLSVSDSKFTANSATLNGGAIHLQSAAKLVVQSSSFTGNVANVKGGAIYFNSGGSGNFTGSTFSANSANGGVGGAVYFFGTIAADGLTFRNSTFDGNFASGGGGAIALPNVVGTPVVQNSTLTGNTVGAGQTGGGIAVIGTPATIAIDSSIVAGNLTADAVPANTDISSAGTVNFNRSAYTAATGFTITGTNNVANLNVSATLDPLANNGGSTLTRALKAGANPLRDAGSNVASLATDQRGSGFLRVVNSAADIGAYESQTVGDSNPPTAGSLVAATVSVRNGTTYTFTVTYSDDVAMQVATLGTGDLTVTGPGGFSQLATFVSAAPNADGPSIVATYQITPPGGKWDALDNGSYTVALNASEVSDTTGNKNLAASVGTFAVQAPAAVTSIQFSNSSTAFTGDNILQRSGVKVAKVTYDSVVTYSGSPAAAYSVLFDPTGSKLPVSFTVSTSTVGNHTEAILTFTSNLTPGSASLTDGRYSLTILGTQIQTLNLPTVFLDGDSDNASGGNSVTNFFRFYGDANGDENVDLADIDIFSSCFGATLGDANYLAYMNDDSTVGDVDIDLGDIDSFSNSFATSVLP